MCIIGVSSGIVQCAKLFLVKIVLQCNCYWGLQFHGLGMQSLRISYLQHVKLACYKNNHHCQRFEILVCVLVNSTFPCSKKFKKM